MKKTFLFLINLLFSAAVFGQSVLPRLFLDIPQLSIASPDVENIDRRAGVDLGTAMNLGTHWSTVRLGAGALFSVDASSTDVGDSFLTTPYGLFEVGVGKYRTNGNRCAQTKSNAFTAMAKGGVRYNFDTRKTKPAGETDGYGIDYTVGAEFGYFYIRDVFKNFELFLQGNYHVNAKVISANFGFKTFLNLRADRD